MEPKEKLDLAVRAADDKNAHQITTLDMRGVSLVADYFVICHGNSETQVEAIAREVKDRASLAGLDLKRLEGIEHSRWVLIDLNDVIVHVFHKDDRNYYNLEKLWGDAPTLDVEEILQA
ncbi:ribosome silencing factor [Salipaludibacillus keqinensis]|jgi:ribosome-associated protein|uniref:Ribosomal silencing factor RsfS n=1 Tax=Salipaludibacillus keqinensis TaxID=2045207 RepID=A0A323TGG1_9BACI|nr:ribosome silencing factor [Salipaludibacillus keqinensis]PYZ94222.1 ribosome silencing factor [Salipaludibacillus keqinensis]